MPPLKIHTAESNVAIWKKNIAMLSFVRTIQCSGLRRLGSVIRGLTVFGHPSIVLRVPLPVREAPPNFALIDPVFLPPFSEVTGGRMAAPQTEGLYDDVSASVLRALSGFLMSVALIVPRESDGTPRSEIS
ncbi:hypothetical protein [Bradyrhizobium sp. 138]|uniref:hypothetical protein n=1 Tax=Bradyrhizobium sp. 138 TaxID=2782615 RepID=UPI001FFC09C3